MVVLIDVDNTLLDFDKCAKKSLRNTAKQFNVVFNDEVFASFRKLNRALWKSVELGELDENYVHENRFNKLYENFDTVLDGELFDTIFMNHIGESHEPVEGAHELLEYLSLKHDIYIASNSEYERQYGRLKKAGMLKFSSEVTYFEQSKKNN